MMQLERTTVGSRMPGGALVQQDLAQPSSQSSSRSVARPDGGARLLRVLWERRWLVVTCIALALIGGLIYLAKATPIYASNSRVFVQQSGPRIMTDESFNGTESSTFLADQIELIRSPAILSAAAASPSLSGFKDLFTGENPVGALLSMVSVVSGNKTDILQVSADSPDRLEAAAIVNAVVSAYVEYQSDRQHSTAAEVLKVLEKEKAKRDNELDDLSQQMVDFKKKNGILTFENDKGNIVTQRLAELSDALNTADMDLLNAKLLKDSVDAVGNDPRKIKLLMQAEFAKGVQINVAQDSSEDAMALKKLRSEIDELSGTYLSGNKQMQQLQHDVEVAKQAEEANDAQTAQDDRAVIDQMFLKAQKKDDAIHQEFNDQRMQAFDLAGKSAEYMKLEDDERRSERESDLLDSRIKEIDVSQDTGAFNTTVLDVAKPAGLPVKPDHAKVIAECLVGGLLLGMGLAMLRDWMDQRIRSVDEIAALLDVDVLGLIPSMPLKLTRAQRGQFVHNSPRSLVAESYRTIRTALYFGSSASHLRTILVTSPSPGDGKSTVASNIAIAMAQAGERILLIDADCRRPTQHKIFNLPAADAGLSDVLMGAASVQDAIKPTGIDNLWLLPCGRLPDNPAEVLNSHEFHQLVATFANDYDRVLLDSPPVIPVTDARILAASCDATVVVLRAERSNRKLGIHTVDSLRGIGATVLGAVVNDVSLRKGRYANHPGYGYDVLYYDTDAPVRNGAATAGKSLAVSDGNVEQSAEAAAEEANV